MMMDSNFNRTWSIPNTVTVGRFVLTIPAVLSLFQHRYKVALGLFLFCSVTDGLDGFLARYLNQRTRLGTFLDPLADKLLIASFLLALTLLGHIPVWFAVTIFLRDAGIAGGTFVFLSYVDPKGIRPTFAGKTATVLQFGVVLIVLLNQVLAEEFPEEGISFLPLLFQITVVLSLLSAAQYVFRFSKKVVEVQFEKYSRRF